MGLEAVALPLALVVGALGATRLACAALRSDDADLSLAARVTCGIALLSAAAGWLVAAHVYSRSAALAGLGAAGMGLLMGKRRRGASQLATDSSPPQRVRDGLLLALVSAVVLARMLGALRFPHYNPCDDWVVYLHFPRLLLETGSFDEPFSMRRLGVLGAGPFVQGFFWPSLGISANAMADVVFGQLAIVAGAVALRDACAPAARSLGAASALALLALLATLTIPYLNTLPMLLPFGVTLLLLVMHARAVMREPDSSSPRDAMLFGALAALLIGLRVSNAVVPAVLWSLELARAAIRRDRVRLRLSGIAALSTGFALAPWCVALWHSSATPLFPLFRGDYRFPSLFTEPLTVRQTTRYVVECVLATRVLFVVGLAGIACARRGVRVIAIQVALTMIALVVSTAVSMTAFDSWTVLRYCGALVVPALVVLGALIAFSAERSRSWRPALAALAASWLLVPITTHRVFDAERFSLLGFAQKAAGEWAVALRNGVHDGFTLEDFGGRPPYAEAQRRLPAGARVVSTAEQAYLWRHDLHTVHSLDCLGQVSPEPGMPFFEGAEAMASYFISLGYTHLAFTPPRRSFCLYSDTHWLAHRTKGQWMWRQWAPYFLDFMGTQRELAHTRQVLFRGPTLVVVDLRKRTEAP